MTNDELAAKLNAYEAETRATLERNTVAMQLFGIAVSGNNAEAESLLRAQMHALLDVQLDTLQAIITLGRFISKP